MTGRRWTKLLAAVAGGVVAATATAVRQSRTEDLDREIGIGVRTLLPERAVRGLAWATDFGSAYAVVGVTATTLVFSGTRRAADVAVRGLGAWTIGQVAKNATNRQRPYEHGWADMQVERPAGSSFPSGHASVGGALAHGLGLGPIAGSALAGMIGLSRVAVGVHHPTDVVAGTALGVSVSAAWDLVRPWPID